MDEDILSEAMSLYTDDAENHEVSVASAEVEYENYCQMTRIEEIIEFAKKSKQKKIGNRHLRRAHIRSPHRCSDIQEARS